MAREIEPSAPPDPAADTATATVTLTSAPPAPKPPKVSLSILEGRTIFSPVGGVIARFADPSTFEQVHGPAMAIGADCARCPLRMTDQGPVLHEVRPNSKLAILAESPGDNELLQRRPLVGWSGQQVEAALGMGGLLRDDVSLINTIMCKPVGLDGYSQMVADLQIEYKRECRRLEALNQPLPPPPVMPSEACRGAAITALREANAPVWVTLGKPALEAAAAITNVAYDKDKLTPGEPHIAPLVRQHGHPVWLPPWTSPEGVARPEVLLAAYHPSFAAKDKKEYLQLIVGVIRRAAEAAVDRKSIAWQEFCDTMYLEPSEEDIRAFLTRALLHRAELVVDVETDSRDRNTAKLLMIQLGMTLHGSEEAIVIWVAHKDGTPWWKNGELDRLKPHIRQCLDELPLAGQFLQYDTTILIRDGYMSWSATKTWTDLAILYRSTTYNDLPKNLGAIVSTLFPAPMWKGDVDHKSADNADDAALARYGVKDVIYEMRCLAPLRQKVEACETQAVVQLDTDLLPIWREMGLLGFVVDEKTRGEYSKKFNVASVKAARKLQAIAGSPINPRSVPQLQELLFHTWKIRPVILADGEELEDTSEYLWDDGETGSTSSSALNQILKRRVLTEDQKQFIETLFECRAYDKLRGTYTDNLKTYDFETEEWNKNEPRVPRVIAPRSIVDDDGRLTRFEAAEVLAERGRYSRVMPVYISHTIPTGRSASNDPNAQNIPAAGKANIRSMFVAPPGHVIVGADFDQLEARIYAALSGDALILRAIKEGQDIHALNAATLLSKDPSEFWYWYGKVNDKSDENAKFRKYWRNIAKRFFFLEVYGGEIDMLWDVMANARDRATGKLSFPDITKDEVIEWHERCHRDHPEIRQWHKREHNFTDQFGYAQVPILDQRKRHFPDGASKVNAIPNTPVQGSAAACANRAMKAIAELIGFRSWSRWTGLFLQVHDFLAAYVPESKVDQAVAIFNKCMPYSINGVPITASAVASRVWAHQDTMEPYQYGTTAFDPEAQKALKLSMSAS